MVEFLCKGFKCTCGQLVKVAQIDKSKPSPMAVKGQQMLAALYSCPRCHRDTFVRPDELLEWNETVTVQ
jgi:hypothetical protein